MRISAKFLATCVAASLLVVAHLPASDAAVSENLFIVCCVAFRFLLVDVLHSCSRS